MRARPSELTWLALLLAAIVASFPLQIMLIFGDTPWDPSAIMAKLTPLNWAVMILAALLSYLVLEASPWVWFISPAFVLVTVWNNWLIAQVIGGAWSWIAFLASVAVIGTQALLFRPEAFRVLTHPGLRWWRTPVRKRVSVETSVCPVSGGEFATRTFDLSENGAFITVTGASWITNHVGSFRRITVGSYCNMRFKLNQVAAFSCTAQIVRRCEAARGRYPEGFGVRFVGLGARERKTLQAFLTQLPSTKAGVASEGLPASKPTRARETA